MKVSLSLLVTLVPLLLPSGDALNIFGAFNDQAKAAKLQSSFDPYRPPSKAANSGLRIPLKRENHSGRLLAEMNVEGSSYTFVVATGNVTSGLALDTSPYSFYTQKQVSEDMFTPLDSEVVNVHTAEGAPILGLPGIIDKCRLGERPLRHVPFLGTLAQDPAFVVAGGEIPTGWLGLASNLNQNGVQSKASSTKSRSKGQREWRRRGKMPAYEAEIEGDGDQEEVEVSAQPSLPFIKKSINLAAGSPSIFDLATAECTNKVMGIYYGSTTGHIDFCHLSDADLPHTKISYYPLHFPNQPWNTRLSELAMGAFEYASDKTPNVVNWNTASVESVYPEFAAEGIARILAGPKGSKSMIIGTEGDRLTYAFKCPSKDVLENLPPLEFYFDAQQGDGSALKVSAENLIRDLGGNICQSLVYGTPSGSGAAKTAIRRGGSKQKASLPRAVPVAGVPYVFYNGASMLTDVYTIYDKSANQMAFIPMEKEQAFDSEDAASSDSSAAEEDEELVEALHGFSSQLGNVANQLTEVIDNVKETANSAANVFQGGLLAGLKNSVIGGLRKLDELVAPEQEEAAKFESEPEVQYAEQQEEQATNDVYYQQPPMEAKQPFTPVIATDSYNSAANNGYEAALASRMGPYSSPYNAYLRRA